MDVAVQVGARPLEWMGGEVRRLYSPMAKVSIIVPVYNVEKYLARCLDSVCSQTERDIEIICVNDGSTDSSAAILDDYAGKDSRIRILSQPNGGLAAARNAGLDAATGDWVMFVDSDDFIPPYAVEGFLKVAAESGASVVVSSDYAVDRLPDARTEFKWRVCKPALDNLVGRRKIQSSAWNKFYRRDTIGSRRFIEGIYFEDWPFVTELFGDLPSFALVDTQMYVYCKNGVSIVRSAFTEKKVASYLMGIRHVAEYFAAHAKKRLAQRRCATAARMLIAKVTKSKDSTLYAMAVYGLRKLFLSGAVRRNDLGLKTLFRYCRLAWLCRNTAQPEANGSAKRILFWGRFNPGYSRNRVVREALREEGFEIEDFRPCISSLGDMEARLFGVAKPDIVWVPCFRLRDLPAASRWARSKGVPLVFDPLISAYQKQVFERRKFSENSVRARRLLAHERAFFAKADAVVADTCCHSAFYRDVLGVDGKKLHIVHVGASKEFKAAPPRNRAEGSACNVLFYGSFIPLHGVKTVVGAARLTQGESICWTLLGDGPEKEACAKSAEGLGNIRFEDPIPYERLCNRIHEADVLLGIFGDTAQASRVMPNKFFQALASGRPIVTRRSDAYPEEVAKSPAVIFVAPGDEKALADAVRSLACDKQRLDVASREARRLFDTEFSLAAVRRQISEVLFDCMQGLHKANRS